LVSLKRFTPSERPFSGEDEKRGITGAFWAKRKKELGGTRQTHTDERGRGGELIEKTGVKRLGREAG